jgi:hypothetical protein
MAGEFLRVTASLAAAATTSATVFVAADLTLFFTGGGEGNSLGSATETARFLWPIAFGVASLHALGLGWPAYLAAKRLGLTRWWVGLSGGFLTGSLPYAVLALPWRRRNNSSQPISLRALPGPITSRRRADWACSG